MTSISRFMGRLFSICSMSGSKSGAAYEGHGRVYRTRDILTEYLVLLHDIVYELSAHLVHYKHHPLWSRLVRLDFKCARMGSLLLHERSAEWS